MQVDRCMLMIRSKEKDDEDNKYVRDDAVRVD